jgi:hypothetical protein
LHGLISSITVASLVAHLILGCCRHHAHDESCQADPASHATSTANLDSTWAEPCCGSVLRTHGLDHPVHPLCQDGRCVFLPRLSDRHASAVELSVPASPARLASAPALPDALSAPSRFPAVLALAPRPIRAHLRFQVLLL